MSDVRRERNLASPVGAVLAVAACAAGMGACGGDDEAGPIPREEGDALLAQLDQIDAAANRGECEDAQALALEFSNGVDALPPEVDGELRQALVEAGANLEQLSSEQCEPDTGATGETGDEPTTTTPTTTTETPETTTETTTEEPPDDDQGPPDEPPGGGNGNPGGGNSGGGSDDGDFSGGIGSDG